jgi:hypothetical protein
MVHNSPPSGQGTEDRRQRTERPAVAGLCGRWPVVCIAHVILLSGYCLLITRFCQGERFFAPTGGEAEGRDGSQFPSSGEVAAVGGRGACILLPRKKFEGRGWPRSSLTRSSVSYFSRTTPSACGGHPYQETGNRRQETGNREQETGNRKVSGASRRERRQNHAPQLSRARLGGR